MVLKLLKRIKYNLEIFIGRIITHFLLSSDHTKWFDGVEFLYQRYPQNVIVDKNVKLYKPYRMDEVKIGRGTYIAVNSNISKTEIGCFCSIGPNFSCGWGIHPVDGLSTSPAFYSTMKQNGMTFSDSDKVIERRSIKIGSDVFIGMNVTVLDGVTIGDGAIVGAGAVVVKDVVPYSVVGGVPAKHIKYRFDEMKRRKLLDIKWWNWDDDRLLLVSKYFFDIDKFINESS